MSTLTDAIRQVEQALARGERLSEVVNWVSRDFAIDRALLTRRWVQFTPRPESPPRPALLGIKLVSGTAGRQVTGGK